MRYNVFAFLITLIFWLIATMFIHKTPKEVNLVQYGKEWCDYHGYKYLDVIPINDYEVLIDSVQGSNQRWVQYYFNPVGSLEAFYADDIRYGGFDTTFVVRYKDVDPSRYTDMISIVF